MLRALVRRYEACFSGRKVRMRRRVGPVVAFPQTAAGGGAHHEHTQAMIISHQSKHPAEKGPTARALASYSTTLSIASLLEPALVISVGAVLDGQDERGENRRHDPSCCHDGRAGDRALVKSNGAGADGHQGVRPLRRVGRAPSGLLVEKQHECASAVSVGAPGVVAGQERSPPRLWQGMAVPDRGRTACLARAVQSGRYR